MDINPVIFDISSDEELAFDELKVGDDVHEWLTGLLETVDRETADMDADDVVVVGEYIPPKSMSKSKPLKVVKDIDDDDCDCVVLDGDPDKPLSVVEDAVDDGDDVLVVGETGQIACRDYPHPRHHCAKFPFSSTPHEQHCNMCHCYVCDTLAPCVHWGNGISTVDHCHATDKLEIWKNRRHERFRLKKSPLAVLRFPEARLPAAASQLNQVPALNEELMPNGRHNEVYGHTTTHAFAAGRMSIPNIISQNGNRHHAHRQDRNGLGPCSVSHQALGVRSNASLQKRGQQLLSCTTMFKRPGLVRSALAKNQLVYSSSNTYLPPASYVRNTVSLAATNAGNSARWQDVLPTMVSGSCMHPSTTQPETGCVSASAVVQPEFRSVSITLTNNDQNIHQLGNQIQNVVDSDFSDFEFWINTLDQTNQQSSVSNNEPAVETQFTSQLGGRNEPMKDPDYKTWLLGQSEDLASEVCVPVDMNIFSPVPSAYDAGMLCFDFETSWNGLAQV